MKKKLSIPLAALAAALGSAGTMAAETEYKHPVAAIPYAATKPVIDGTVNDAEWQGAFSQRALRTTGGQISSRQARFWMMWDEENLYIAMRDPLRPGERPIQQHRGRASGTDMDIIFDDCYEIWISVGATDTLTGQPDCSTQFLGNFAGGRYDAIHQPAVGNSRTSSYDTNWEPKSRLTDKNEWEMELVIPRASLGTTKGPFHDGMRFRTLIARNYKRPWEQCSFEGTSSFSVIDTHSEFVMSKSAPGLHLLGVGDAAAGKIGLHLATLGQTDAKIAWRYASDTVTRDGTAQVKKGVLGEVVNLPELDTPGDGKGKVRITVTDAKGATLLDWQSQRVFAGIPKEAIADRGDVLDLSLTFNPVRDYARVFGDFINFDARDAIQEIVITVRDAAGKEVKRATTTIDDDAYAKEILHFENLALGTYTVRLECLDKDAKVIAATDSTFTKEDLAKKYEWWNTTRGSIEKVIAPWTPVTLRRRTLGVWGREMEIGAAGIPARVSTQGKEILAAPGRLVATLADGKQVTAEGVKAKTRFDQDHRKIVEVSSKLGEIAITSEVRAEFDGMYKVTMTLTPKGPTAVKDLKLVLPYAEAMGEYVHAVTAEIRSGYWYGFTPQGKGRVWDCRMLGDKSMKVGSFIPYIWIGSTKGGLCWFADSDEGWLPNDEVPAVEIQRNKAGQVDLVFNLVSAEATLEAPRTITFALQASPVKAMPPRWRENNWWCGDTFKNYAHEQNLIFASTPFVVPAYIEKSKAIVEAQHKGGRPAVPYFIHSALLPGHLIPELAVFSEEWRSRFMSYGSGSLVYEKTLNDYMIHNWSKFAEQTGIDGYYVDNMAPMQCDKIEAGRGYRLPDGRIQPAFQMFGTREYFLRSRAAFLEQRPKSMIVLHMTNCMILPWVAAADLTYDGEHHVTYPEMKKDFMDFWSLVRMRVDFPGQWGVPVDFMHEYQGQWPAADMYRAMRAYFATVMLHDALPYGNNNGFAGNLIAQRKAFGIGEDDVKFLAYWDETGLKAKGEEIKLAGWQRPGKLLLLVANFGEKQTAQVAFDLEKLGWKGATLAVSDPEQGQKITVHGHGGAATVTHDAPAPQLDGTKLTVPVERHNYRLLVVEQK